MQTQEVRLYIQWKFFMGNHAYPNNTVDSPHKPKSILHKDTGKFFDGKLYKTKKMYCTNTGSFL